MLVKKITIKCPYCELEQMRTINLKEFDFPQVALCHPGRGGCDRIFVFDIQITNIDIELTLFKTEQVIK